MHPIVATLLAAMHAHAQGAKKQPSADAHLAAFTAAHLQHALAIATDPELKQHLAAASLTLHKHLATLSKEHAGMMQGKLPARAMSGASR